jgi:hypothetical protein
MRKKLTTEEFIVKAKEVHGEKYDYSKVLYTNAKAKIVIICPMHGAFDQRSDNHLQGQNCPTCAMINNRSNLKEFITKAKLVHKNKYDYSKVIYKDSRTKVTITCPEHGEFKQTPNNHLKGQICPNCVVYSCSNTEEFINKAIIVHSNKYMYNKVNYTMSKTKVTIICPIHGHFEQTPNRHLAGQGCPGCAAHGFDISKPGVLYYLKITTDDGQVLYKIGITNNSVNERFSLTELSKIEIIKQKLYENGQDAYDWEQKLLKMYKQYQYTGPKILVSGNTELFTKDIVALYYKDNDL